MQAVEFQMETLDTGPDRVRVALRGELDLASGPSVQAELERLRAAGTPVVLDLSGLEFMDSAGLVAILTAVQDARREQAPLEVDRVLRPSVERLFALTRTDDFLWPASSAPAR